MRRPSPWVVLVPLSAAAVVLGVGISEGVHARQKEPEIVWVDPSAVVLDDFPAWADSRWYAELDALLEAWEPFRADDRAALAALHGDLGALSFIAQADPPLVDRAGDLRLGFRLRRPAACIHTAAGFLTVSEDGVVLTGRWAEPPRLDELRLPVVLPRLAPDDPDPASDPTVFRFDHASPGDWLVEPPHLAALATAISLGEHLAPGEAARLGRVAIDGAGYAVEDADDPGVLLGLEDGRWVVFGRAPGGDHPGELPPAHKWRALASALALASEGGEEGAWRVCDVRWDVPELGYAPELAERLAVGREPAWPELPAAYPTGWYTEEGASLETAGATPLPERRASAARASQGRSATETPPTSGSRPRVR